MHRIRYIPPALYGQQSRHVHFMLYLPCLLVSIAPVYVHMLCSLSRHLAPRFLLLFVLLLLFPPHTNSCASRPPERPTTTKSNMNTRRLIQARLMTMTKTPAYYWAITTDIPAAPHTPVSPQSRSSPHPYSPHLSSSIPLSFHLGNPHFLSGTPVLTQTSVVRPHHYSTPGITKTPPRQAPLPSFLHAFQNRLHTRLAVSLHFPSPTWSYHSLSSSNKCPGSTYP